VPGWAEGRRGRVTVRHLLTMSSGLIHTPDDVVRYAGRA
jgi:CubicO group peptidase (beta-lactamase class C family)